MDVSCGPLFTSTDVRAKSSVCGGWRLRPASLALHGATVDGDGGSYLRLVVANQNRPPSCLPYSGAQLAAAVARNPGKVAFLCVVESSADPPDDAERNASAAMVNEHGANLLGVACVIEGTGFRGAITRTVLSGIALVIRSRVSIKMFESVRAASPWLARCVHLASLPELHEQVERGRALLTACTLRDRETARA